MTKLRQSDGTPLEPAAPWTLGRIARRAASLLASRGPKTLIFKVLGETIYRRVLVLEDDLALALSPLEDREGIEHALLDEGAVDDYLTLRSDQQAEEVRRRLRAGERCAVSRHRGRVVSAAWSGCDRARIDPLDCEIALTAEEVYQHDSYTDPDYRGYRLPASRARWLRPILRADGIRRRLAVVESEDPSAARHAAHAGFRPIGRLARVRVGRWHRYVVRPSPGAAARFPTPSRRIDWDRTAAEVSSRGYSVDPLLAAQKRRAYLDLVARWGGGNLEGPVLKTDLFEESLGDDAFLDDLGGGREIPIGIDRSVRIARAARVRRAAPRAELVAADARRLPFQDRTFSLVVSPSTLDHFPDERDLGRSLGEILRVLRPGGVLVVTLDNRGNVTDGWLRAVAALGLVPFPLGRSYSRAELVRELVQVGFEVTDTTTILHAPRLFAYAGMRIARMTRSEAVARGFARLLAWMQRLEKSRFADRTGSFVAARALRPPLATGS